LGENETGIGDHLGDGGGGIMDKSGRMSEELREIGGDNDGKMTGKRQNARSFKGKFQYPLAFRRLGLKRRRKLGVV
jgi:hypothetical protein